MSNVTFQPVDARSGVGNGKMTILRGSKLVSINDGAKSEAPLAAGTTVEGTYQGTTPNKFEPTRVDYNLRGEDGTLIIMSENASLRRQFESVAVGELVQVIYNGKRAITRKNGAKAEMHDFQVLRASQA
jgi:hypothetical protein